MKNILIVMGPPGSGKGTQATKLKDKYGITHISTGDMFRSELKNETELGIEAKKYMDSGRYVPDAVTIGMLEKRIDDSDCENGFILDGFPRTVPQAEFLDNLLENIGTPKILYYDVSDSIVVERIKGRAVEDKEAGRQVREDDLNVDTIQKRLDTYHSSTKPVLDHYAAKGLLVTVDASRAIDEIYQESLEKLA